LLARERDRRATDIDRQDRQTNIHTTDRKTDASCASFDLAKAQAHVTLRTSVACGAAR